MKKGKYFRIPESPTDMRTLWNEARLLQPDNLPNWLTPESAESYRHVGVFTCANLPAPEQKRYVSELKELEASSLIVEEDPRTPFEHNIHVAAPDSSEVWSIGIYTGKSPCTLAPSPYISNPVLTHEDVSDVPAMFVADPFMVRVNEAWYMFFEVFNWRTNKGEIGLATSKDTVSWSYQKIVLAEDFHLSYPYVFEWMNEFYMIPESHQAGSVRLYKAVDFPSKWSHVGNMLSGPYFVDSSLVRYCGKWWLFTETNADVKHDTLRLYYANDLAGPWLEHPESPIIQGNPHISRPAGRVLVVDGNVIRYAQNCHPYYGTEVRAFVITELTTMRYREHEAGKASILAPTGVEWNASGMHHVDAHLVETGLWLACVDGRAPAVTDEGAAVRA